MACLASQNTSDGGYLPTTQVRRLRPKARLGLTRLLDMNNGWQELASVIPHPSRQGYLFTANDIRIMENRQSPAEVLLEHWSTMGNRLPTLEDLLNLLLEANLLRAAHYVSEELLQTPRNFSGDSSISTEELEVIQNRNEFVMGRELTENCHISPGSSSNERSSVLSNSAVSEQTVVANEPYLQNRVDCPEHRLPHAEHKPVTKDNDTCKKERIGLMSSDLHQQLNASRTISYNYEDLAIVTNDFDNLPLQQGGRKIGEGAFGVVYHGYISGCEIAVKKLKNAIDGQYLTELRVLTRYRHENLLPLLGYSIDGPYACLVYAYMVNGSLQERLACVGNTRPIPWPRRIELALGTARGIIHLHTFLEEPLVHRDIKSANVLLDENWVPKVGDFGLVRTGDSGNTTTVAVTEQVFGTSVYMAREAFRGDVSVKLDTFSYGVVLLELLTGLAPYDPSREDKDLISYMEDRKSREEIMDVLDKKVGQWNIDVAVSLHDIAKSCLEERKKARPTMTQGASAFFVTECIMLHESIAIYKNINRANNDKLSAYFDPEWKVILDGDSKRFPKSNDSKALFNRALNDST